MRIVVRATNWLGDAVMALPALRAVRASYPDAHLAVLARPWVADLYGREPFADQILTEAPSWRGRLRTARRLRELRFDLALLLPNSFSSAAVARLAGIPRRIGYDRDGRGFLLTQRIAPPGKGEIPEHESFYYLELLRRAGMLAELPPPGAIEMACAAQARADGLALFREMGMDQPVVGVSPGAQNSRAKQWPAERFIEAACQVAGPLGGAVAIFGSKAERPLAIAMAAEVRKRGLFVLSLAGETTLRQFIDLAAACRVFLTNDSGAMHVASALCVPTVAVYGPTDWVATAPSGPVHCIVREPVPCAPCMLRDCPIDHRCMRGVSAERVAQAALELVK